MEDEFFHVIISNLAQILLALADHISQLNYDFLHLWFKMKFSPQRHLFVNVLLLFCFFSIEHVVCARSSLVGFSAPENCGTTSCSRDFGCIRVQRACDAFVAASNTHQQLDQNSSKLAECHCNPLDD